MSTNDPLGPELSERVAAVSADRSHGASELACACLQLVADAATTLPAENARVLTARLAQLAERLQQARPSMTPVLTLLATWRRRLDSAPQESLTHVREHARRCAEQLIGESRRAVDTAAAQAAAVLRDCHRVVGYSYSATVEKALCALPVGVTIHVSEARPVNEGHRLAAALARAGHNVTLVTDALLGTCVRDADAVLVGADSVLADGTLINKAGTLSLAAVARCFEVPFYACCDTFKLRDADMPEPELESMSPHELGAPHWPGVTVSNVYFDRTPPQLLSRLITDKGPIIFPGYRDAA